MTNTIIEKNKLLSEYNITQYWTRDDVFYLCKKDTSGSDIFVKYSYKSFCDEPIDNLIINIIDKFHIIQNNKTDNMVQIDLTEKVNILELYNIKIVSTQNGIMTLSKETKDEVENNIIKFISYLSIVFECKPKWDLVNDIIDKFHLSGKVKTEEEEEDSDEENIDTESDSVSDDQNLKDKVKKVKEKIKTKKGWLYRNGKWVNTYPGSAYVAPVEIDYTDKKMNIRNILVTRGLL